MVVESKVFTSNIIRLENKLKNNLKDIFNVTPAIPLQSKSLINTKSSCDFVPKNDKHYVPRKRISAKVRTVRDIRNAFESDVYTYLPADLERQKNLLLRKISSGSARDGKTKELAKNILNSSAPISKSAWQMIMNINPEEHTFPSQYVLWNGKCILVNGSKGGRKKFICKRDITKINRTLNQSMVRKDALIKKKSLLHHSLDIKFKPGPLTKKKYLDNTYQRYQFGDMKLVSLPKPGLDIQPSYGKPLAPAINTFIHNAFLLNADGVISQNWANFSVSVLGTMKNGTPVQTVEDCNVTFDLDYKCLQRRILMRHDSDIVQQIKISTDKPDPVQDETIIISEVANVLNDILNSVEISLKQNEMFSGVDEPREVTKINNSLCTTNINQLKDRGKRKFGELDRLDVTVITIAESSDVIKNDVLCQNAHCYLGCICDSLKSSSTFKRHCGRFECMFKCKCDFSKYNLTDSFNNDCSDILPGLVNFDMKLGQTLAKEEHKFHQTVIVTNEKSILLKSKRRNWKASKRYADFYSKMPLKAMNRDKQELSIVCTNLDLKNVEPWCMVHNLYKCFCKGKFVEKCSLSIHDVTDTSTIASDVDDKNKKVIVPIDLSNDTPTNTLKTYPKIQHETRISGNSNEKSEVIVPLLPHPPNSYSKLKCARTLPYDGRKYDEEYYRVTNQKILEMERNDKKLHKKMMILINNGNTLVTEDQDLQKDDLSCPAPSLNELLSSVISPKLLDQEEHVVETKTAGKSQLPLANIKRLPNKESLVSWLESNYKFYKDQTHYGPMRTGLDPPKYGKIALYPWNFILSRYRDRKNLFLISKQKPFRIFMAVNTKNPFFSNCINISDIALSDLSKFPDTIKNLLTNATETKDNFYILYGLSFCWELIGSVTKVNDSIKDVTQENEESLTVPEDVSENMNILDSNCFEIDSQNTIDSVSESIELAEYNVPEESSNQFKWFLMTIEDDFSEIQFFVKGFFVKYDSLIKATSVAKRLGKTVRLSSQKCCGTKTSPQFGIYAIPSSKNNYVFIGPYEKDEVLGIETVKTVNDMRKVECTRGTWITTNEIDNLNVINNPLLYMPSKEIVEKMITLETNTKRFCESDNDTSSYDESSADILNDKHVISKETSPKIVRPIKIIKSNNFYKFGLLKQKSLILNKSLLVKSNTSKISLLSSNDQEHSKTESLSKLRKLIIVPPKTKEDMLIHNKIDMNDNIATTSTSLQRKHGGSMFVLKPEEINKKSFENNLPSSSQSQTENKTRCEMDMDIERFLSMTKINTVPKDAIFVISDDENDTERCGGNWKDVWIVCKNIANIGWIAGRRNATNHLSFEFPGFMYTDFYTEEEAFNKINQVLARKVYVPKHILLQWSVVESLTDDMVNKKLLSTHLTSDYVLTRKGLLSKYNLMMKVKYLNKLSKLKNVLPKREIGNIDCTNKATILNELEETSQTLVDESLFLWDKTIAKKEEIMESFAKTSEELRKELTDQLNNIKYNAEELT
ncbi:unnamed protein product, partial [Brenthis ino]